MPRARCVACQSVVAAGSLYYPGIAVGVHIAVHGYVAVVEVGTHCCRCLIAAGRECHTDGCRYFASIHAEAVIDIAVAVNAELLVAHTSGERYAAKAVGRVDVAVVERSLYGCRAVIH